MAVDQIQVNYDRLRAIAGQYRSSSDQVRRMSQQIQQSVDVLHRTSWIGTAATAFFREMDGEVMPAMKRLANAMQSASEVTTQLITHFQQAEQEAAAPFKQGDGAVGSSVQSESTKGGAGNQPIRRDSFPDNPAAVNQSLETINRLNLAENYQPSGEDTYCNIFVMDYARARGVPLPEELDWNNDGITDRNLNANQATAWLRGTFNEGGGAVQQGPELGWKKMDADQAAELASKGYVVVAGWENPDGGHGHMAVVRPDSSPGNIYIAQAGMENFEKGSIIRGFGTGRNIEYFAYLPDVKIGNL